MRKANFLLKATLAAVMLVFAVACASGPQNSAQVVASPERLPLPGQATALNNAVPAPLAAAAVSGPPRITAQAVKEKTGKGVDVVIVDVRSKANYDQSHIVNAISIPLGELEERDKELRQESAIITYCT